MMYTNAVLAKILHAFDAHKCSLCRQLTRCNAQKCSQGSLLGFEIQFWKGHTDFEQKKWKHQPTNKYCFSFIVLLSFVLLYLNQTTKTNKRQKTDNTCKVNEKKTNKHHDFLTFSLKCMQHSLSCSKRVVQDNKAHP